MSYFRLKHGDFPIYGRGSMVQYISGSNPLVSYVDYVYFVGDDNNSTIIDMELAVFCTEVGFL